MINKHIEIVSSTVPGLSSMSQKSRDAILVVLKKHYSNVSVTIVNNLADLDALVARQPDLVFLGMKFLPVNPLLGVHDLNKIWVADYLERNGIATTGSGHLAQKLEVNKPLAKQRALSAGLKTARFYVAKHNQPIIVDTALNFPMFIKPANLGGGAGVDSNSTVHDFAALSLKVHAITSEFHTDSLIEEYLPGREFSVAILKDEDSEKYQVMPIELSSEPDDNGVRLLSQETKLANSEVILEVTDKLLRAKIETLAISVFRALGARDYGRIDIRLDENGTPHFLEANLIPSIISGYGSFPKACVLNLGLDYEPMILSIVRLGLTRSTSTLPKPDLAIEAFV